GDRYVHRRMLAVADDLERDARADGSVGDQIGDGLVGRDLLAVDLHDYVALGQAALRRRTAGDDRAHDLAAVLGQAEGRRDILVERLEPDAEIAARRTLAAHQRVDHRLRRLGGNGQTDAH